PFLAIAIVLSAVGGSRSPGKAERWKKVVINAESPFEAAAVADFDGDGRLDIFSGDSWYQAPRWRRHKVREVAPVGHYHQDMGDLVLDVNGDGRPALVTCTYFSQMVGWLERPADPTGPWIPHPIDTPGSSEACQLVDINGDGRADLLPNTNNAVV